MKKPAKRRGRPPGSGAGREYTVRINIPVTDDQRTRYAGAAAVIGVPLAEWVREACEVAVARQDGEAP